jgi:polar amino acid transport system permease protein
MIFTALPQIGIRLSVVEAAIFGLSINEGAYLSEIFRGGILSIDRGQIDAARAIGMPYWTTMRRIVLPQAARVVLPPLGNQFNGMLKATSLASVISMDELLRSTQYLIELTFRSLELFTIACMYYLAMTTCWSFIQRRLEAHFSRSIVPTAAVPDAPQRREIRHWV